MTMIVLDTSALIFWTLANDRLSVEARDAVQQATNISISSISIWEIGLKAKKGRLTLPTSISEYVNRLKQLRHFKIIPVDETIWLKNLSLAWEHQDPADRTIVATAVIQNCPLVTSDKMIRAFYAQVIW